MLRVPIVPTLLISVAVFALSVVGPVATGEDGYELPYAGYGLSWAAVTYFFLRSQALSAMERCTVYGVIGSMLIIFGFQGIADLPGIRAIREWLIPVLFIVTGVLVLFSPYLFRERLERQQEEWDQAARYWKRKRLERRKSAS